MVICGVAHFGRQRGDLPSIEGVLDSLSAYGDVVHRANIAASGLDVSVGTRGLRSASAPIAARNADALTVVGDLRLDRADQLATELGVPLSSAPPDLVLAAYRRWGDACPEHLDGDFAFVVVDPTRPCVLLVVDHAARRPLAAHEREGLVAFASSALALTALDGVGHDIDLERALEVLALVPSNRTFVAGVRLLPPGSAMRIGPDGVDRWRWWRPEDIEVRDRGSLDAHAFELRDRLDDAVGAMVAGSGRVGVSLSGGLDSTSVAATAARLRDPEWVHSYTSVPPPGWTDDPAAPRDADDTDLVRLLAEAHPNLRPRFVDVVGRDLFGGHEPLWELGAPPTRNAANATWVHAIREEAAADGVDLLLTGGMGNGAFSADGPRVLVELSRRGHVVRAAREARARAARTGASTAAVVRSDLLALVAPAAVRHRRSGLRTAAARSAEWLRATAVRPERYAEVDLFTTLPVLDAPDTTGWRRDPAAWFDRGVQSGPNNLAVRGWWGIDTRDPTAERRLVEAALAQPEWWRRHAGIDRAVVRRAMADRLPREIVDRTRRGAQLPDWFDRLTDARVAVEGELEALRDHPPSRSLIDLGRLTTLVRSWPDREDARTLAALRDYRLALTRALLVSRYLRWFEHRARRVAAGGPALVLPAR